MDEVIVSNESLVVSRTVGAVGNMGEGAIVVDRTVVCHGGVTLFAYQHFLVHVHDEQDK